MKKLFVRELVVEKVDAHWSQLEVETVRNTFAEVRGSAFPNVERGEMCIVVGYSSGCDRQRSGSLLPAMRPRDARRFALAILQAAEAAEDEIEDANR